MTDPIDRTRRLLFHRSARVAALGAAAVWAPSVRAGLGGARSLALFHTHTGERIDLVYAVGEQYVPAAMAALNRFLRDHYSGEVGTIDPQVFDQLHQVQRRLGGSATFEVISGYRCPATNARLRATRGGGVAPNSLHLQGRAVDVRLPGTPLADLRDAALSLRCGGVGYYPREQFVHFDTGRVRSW
ncbi:MAG TPA: DUF882 domain-containing protein [Burkholderiaceae bacterium]|nr:DUF882 domain-containing protein [Burkholderiaceae bacterium]